MIGAGNVVADHFRRLRANEDGAGIADAITQRLGGGGGNLQVFGGDAISECGRLVERAELDNGAEDAPAAVHR